MWEFLVKKAFPRRPENLTSDIQAAHSIHGSHSAEKVDGDEEHPSDSAAPHSEKKNRALMCPVCAVSMEVRKVGSLEIDQCPRCEGVFLDRGELRILSGVEDSYFQKEDHKFLIYTPHGLSDSVQSKDKTDHD
ncbi:MAG: zf-TFIIB domain-containing protein [Spirochaetia bacterium]|nr:zf-TFIIB domain-containing protein [Spirochaetia bacterium]